MERVRLRHQNGRWHVDVQKAAEAVAEGAWLCLGGCPSPIASMRLWLALKRREGQEK